MSKIYDRYVQKKQKVLYEIKYPFDKCIQTDHNKQANKQINKQTNFHKAENKQTYSVQDILKKNESLSS